MKSTIILSLFMVGLFGSKAAETISVEVFKKLSFPEQVKIIEEAPPEMKESLRKINDYQMYLQDVGGEEGLRHLKESVVASERGVGDFAGLFDLHGLVVEMTGSETLIAYEKQGRSLEDRVQFEMALRQKLERLSERLPIVRSLAFNLAASPEALALNMKAKQLADRLHERSLTRGDTPRQPFTESEILELDKQVTEIFEELKKLPTLPPEQVKREYDALPDSKLPRG